MDRIKATNAVAGIAFAAALVAGCSGGQQQGQGGQEGEVPPAAPAPEQQQQQQPPKPDPAAAKAALQQQIDQALQQRPITFEPDTANLTEQGKQTATKAAELAKSAPQELRFTIAGFIANTGTPKPQDQELSQQRAQAVADKFKEAGVPAERLEAVGRGAAQGNQESDRRVEIKIM